MSICCRLVRAALVLALSCLFIATVAAQPAQPDPAVPTFGPAILRDWVRPEYPPEARSARLEGAVTVEFVVEVDGSVTRETIRNSTDPRFDAAALAAVRQWKFKPALEEGGAAISAMQVPVVFQLAQLRQKNPPLFPPAPQMPVPMKETPARADRNIEPAYPAELEESKIPGEVHLEFTVDAEGRVEEPRVRWATHPAFVEVSLRTIERAAFTPARQGPLAKRSTMQYPVGFGSMGARPADILAANNLTLLSSEPLALLPQVIALVPPFYPRERLLAGETGTAVAEFTIDADGRPREISLTTATQPEFGAALTAAIETWAFKPAQGDEGPVAVRLRATHEFTLRSDQAEYRLAMLLKPGGAGVGSPVGLDRKLKPLWRGFPVYPQAIMAQPKDGEAQIEFIIDRDGRARLPRIVSATEEAFGWAAATAITHWVFERPTKGGEPVDVTVRIPIGFKPPAE